MMTQSALSPCNDNSKTILSQNFGAANNLQTPIVYQVHSYMGTTLRGGILRDLVYRTGRKFRGVFNFAFFVGG